MKIQSFGTTRPFLKLLVYGEPGAGKTVFAGQAMDSEHLGKVLFLPIEGGLISIADRNPDFIDIGRADDGTPNNRTLLDLEDLVWKLVNRAAGYEKYKTVVIDSVTDLQSRDLEEIVKSANRKDADVQLQDYGKDTTRMRRVLRMLRDAKLNVILTALARKEQGENDPAPTEVRPDLTQSLSNSIMGFMDFVWYLYRDKEDNRTILTQSKGAFRAKTRLPAYAELLGPYVKNPNLATMYSQLCEVTEKSK